MAKKQQQELGEEVEKTKKEKPHYYALKVAEAPTSPPFKTMRDTKEILYYQDGVYLLGGEERIEDMGQGLRSKPGATV